jgi:phosphohistidine phosphatase SixA
MPATRTLVILRHAKAAWPEGVADLSLLAWSLSGSDIELSTAGIAVLGLPGGWRGISPGAAQLHSSVTPRAG